MIKMVRFKKNIFFVDGIKKLLLSVSDEKEPPIMHKANGHIPQQPNIDQHDEIKSDEGSPIADEKHKKSDTKEESVIDKIDIKEVDIVNPPESQATVESGQQ